MSRYDYPSHGAPPRKDDDGVGRNRFVARRRAEFDPEGASRARAAPSAQSGPAARAPASSRTNLWLPLGPQTIVDGDTSGKPRVTGRINALAVHANGERLYAASRKGGVWYSGNGGALWRSLGGLAATDTAGINRPAHRNACHAIAVSWGVDEVGDEVWVGTGDVSSKIDGQPGHSVGGIGILHAVGPATPSGLPDPWKREANNLIGRGVYQIALEPGGTGVIAATPEGLFKRPPNGGENVPWVRIAAAPFDTLSARCSDLLWSAADASGPVRLWVWVAEGSNAGLWWRDTGVSPLGPFKKVPLGGQYAGRIRLPDGPRRARCRYAPSAGLGFREHREEHAAAAVPRDQRRRRPGGHPRGRHPGAADRSG